ncbi:lITAF domain-containing protein [Scleropages formosus]|nr:cell death-inducing p53-target protein 1 homolog [Scleropages formosus]XP_018612450.1 cell death-inducing p53-target protein 1 homolog [Scleropages formosus]XP_018612451.1 cell death-inducing p53-target protein 1 homolog [Scleropages formosus]XP_018612452.1 cell death-inducing p53-target protein 1 homolog [Scleropages formosus]
MSAKDPPSSPPPYIIPVADKRDDVKVYHLHTPFNPPQSTEGNQYRVQTFSTSQADQRSKNKFVSYETELGRSPGLTTCVSCQQQVMTNVTYKVGTYAWLICILFILCGLVLGCCLLPFFLKFFKDVYHSCPRCNQILHVEKKRCC